jgi:hypothetical protein
MVSMLTVENAFSSVIEADRASAWVRQAAGHKYTGMLPSTIIRREGLDYNVWKETLSRPNGKPSGYEAVVAHFNGRDIVYGATKDYTIVHINNILASLDSVPYPVESASALSNGKYIAINYDYGHFTICGEEYNMALTILHPYQPGHAWRAMITPIRLHCMNAIVAVKANSISDLRVWHRSPAHSQIDMAVLNSKAVLMKDRLQKGLELLASTRIVDKEEALLSKVYGDTVTAVTVAMLYRKFEAEYPEFAGTGYALYQAAVEAEDYRPMRKNQSGETVAESALIGTRAAKKVQMFSAIEALTIGNN